MTHSLLAQAADSVSYWPLGILAISVVFIVFSIIKLKLHPFLALIFAAVLTGLLTGDLPGMTTENVGLFKNRVALNDTPDDTTNDMLLALNWSPNRWAVITSKALPLSQTGIPVAASQMVKERAP